MVSTPPIVFVIKVSVIVPPKEMPFVAIPKSKAAVIDSPAATPDNGTGNAGIVLVTVIPTVETSKGIVLSDRLVPVYAWVFKYT